MTMRLKTILSLVSTVALLGAVFLWLRFSLERGLDSLARPVSRSLGRSVKASLAPIITARPGIARPAEPNARGALDAYPESSSATEYNDRLLDTWMNGTAARDEILSSIKATEFRGGTDQVVSVSPKNRLDGWGHPFCINKSRHELVLISRGAAIRPLDCDSLPIGLLNPSRFPEGRIVELPGGQLGLFFKIADLTDPASTFPGQPKEDHS